LSNQILALERLTDNSDKGKMASIAVEVLICFEYEFSEIEIGTSTLANIMMRTAVEQHLHLPGFLLRGTDEDTDY
jgi:hypothetical protein